MTIAQGGGQESTERNGKECPICGQSAKKWSYRPENREVRIRSDGPIGICISATGSLYVHDGAIIETKATVYSDG